jgi:hypothetical protein
LRLVLLIIQPLMIPPHYNLVNSSFVASSGF